MVAADSDFDNFLADIRGVFEEIESHLPGVLAQVVEMFHGIPAGSENRMYELADLHGEAVRMYGDQIEVLSHELEHLTALWTGQVGARANMDSLRNEISATHSRLSLNHEMRELAGGTAQGIEIAKWIAAINLVMLAWSLIMAIIGAFFTGGATLAAEAGFFTLCKTAIKEAGEQLLLTIMRRGTLRTLGSRLASTAGRDLARAFTRGALTQTGKGMARPFVRLGTGLKNLVTHPLQTIKGLAANQLAGRAANRYLRQLGAANLRQTTVSAMRNGLGKALAERAATRAGSQAIHQAAHTAAMEATRMGAVRMVTKELLTSAMHRGVTFGAFTVGQNLAAYGGIALFGSGSLELDAEHWQQFGVELGSSLVIGTFGGPLSMGHSGMLVEASAMTGGTAVAASMGLARWNQVGSAAAFGLVSGTGGHIDKILDSVGAGRLDRQFRPHSGPTARGTHTGTTTLPSATPASSTPRPGTGEHSTTHSVDAPGTGQSPPTHHDPAPTHHEPTPHQPDTTPSHDGLAQTHPDPEPTPHQPDATTARHEPAEHEVAGARRPSDDANRPGERPSRLERLREWLTSPVPDVKAAVARVEPVETGFTEALGGQALHGRFTLTPDLVERAIHTPSDQLGPIGQRFKSFIEEHFAERVPGGDGLRPLDADRLAATLRTMLDPPLREPEPPWEEQLLDQVAARYPDAVVAYVEHLREWGILPSAETLDMGAAAGASRADVIARLWQADQGRSERASAWLDRMSPLLEGLGVSPDRFVPPSRRSVQDYAWMELARALDERPFVEDARGSALDSDRLGAATVAAVVHAMDRAEPTGSITKYIEPIRLARRLLDGVVTAHVAGGEPVLESPAHSGDPQPLHPDVVERVVSGLRSAGLLESPTHSWDALRPGHEAGDAFALAARALDGIAAGSVLPSVAEAPRATLESLASRTGEAVGALAARAAHRLDLAEAAQREAEAASAPRSAADRWGRPEADQAAARTKHAVKALHRAQSTQYEKAAAAAKHARDTYQALADALARLGLPDVDAAAALGEARGRLFDAQAAHKAYVDQLALTRPPDFSLPMSVASGPLPGVEALARTVAHLLDAHGVDHRASLDHSVSPRAVSAGSVSAGALGQRLKAEFRELGAGGIVLRFGDSAEVRVIARFGEPVEALNASTFPSEMILGQMPQRLSGPPELTSSAAERGGLAVSLPVLDWITQLPLPEQLGGGISAEFTHRTSHTGGGGVHAQTGNVLDVRRNALSWDVPVVSYEVSIRTPTTMRSLPEGQYGWVTPEVVSIGPDGGSVQLWVPITSSGPVPEAHAPERAPAPGAQRFPEGVVVSMDGLRGAIDAARHLSGAQIGSHAALDIEAQFAEFPSLFSGAVNEGLTHDVTGERGRIGQLTSWITVGGPHGEPPTLLHVSERVLWAEALRLGFVPVRTGADVSDSATLSANLKLQIGPVSAKASVSYSGSSSAAVGADNTGIGVGVHRWSGDMVVYRVPYKHTMEYTPFNGAEGAVHAVRGEALVALTAPDARKYGFPVPAELLRDGPGGERVSRDEPDPDWRPTDRVTQPPDFTTSGHGAGPGRVREVTGVESIVHQLRGFLTDAGLLPRVEDGVPVWSGNPHVREQQLNNWHTIHQLVASQVETMYNQAVQTGIPLTLTGLSGIGPLRTGFEIGVPAKSGTREILLVLEPDFAGTYLGLTDATQQVNLPISSGASVVTTTASRTTTITPFDVAWTPKADGGLDVTRAGSSVSKPFTRSVSLTRGGVLNEVTLNEHGGPMAVFDVPHMLRVVWADDRSTVVDPTGGPIEQEGHATLAWTVDMLPRPEPAYPAPSPHAGPQDTTSPRVLRDAYVVSVGAGGAGEILHAGRAVLPVASRPGTPGFTKLISVVSPVNLLSNARALIRGATWGSDSILSGDTLGSLSIHATVGESTFVGDVKDFVLGRIRFSMLPEGTGFGWGRGVSADTTLGGGVSKAVAGGDAQALGEAGLSGGGARGWGGSSRVARIGGNETLAVDVGDAFLLKADVRLDLTGREQPWDGTLQRATGPVEQRTDTVQAEVLYAIPVRHAVQHYASGDLALPLDQVASVIASYATGHRDLPRLDALALLRTYQEQYQNALAADPGLPSKHPTLPDDTFGVRNDDLREKLAQRLREAFPDVPIAASASDPADVIRTVLGARSLPDGRPLPAVEPGTPSVLPEHLADGGLSAIEQIEMVGLSSPDPRGPSQLLDVVLNRVSRVAPGALEALDRRDALFNLLEGDRWHGFAELMRREEGWTVPTSGDGFRVRLRLVNERLGEYLGRNQEVGLIRQTYAYSETGTEVQVHGDMSVGLDHGGPLPSQATGSSSVGSGLGHGSSGSATHQDTRVARVATFSGVDRFRTTFTLHVEVTRTGSLPARLADAVSGAPTSISSMVRYEAVRLVPADMLRASDLPRAMEPAVDPRPMTTVSDILLFDRTDSTALRAAMTAGLGKLVTPRGTPDVIARWAGERVMSVNAHRLDRLDDPVRNGLLPGELAGGGAATTLEMPRWLLRELGVAGRRFVDVAVEAFVTGTGEPARWPYQAEMGEVDRHMTAVGHGTTRTQPFPLRVSFGGDVPGVGGVKVVAGAPSALGGARSGGSRSETSNLEFGDVVSVELNVQYRVTLRLFEVDRHGDSRVLDEHQVISASRPTRATMPAPAYAEMLAAAERSGGPGHAHGPDAAAAVTVARDVLRDRRMPRFSLGELLDGARQTPDSVPGRYHEAVADAIRTHRQVKRNAPVWIVADHSIHLGARDVDAITFARVLAMDLHRQVILEIPQSAPGAPRIVMTAVHNNLLAVEGADAGFVDELKRLPSHQLSALGLPELERLYDTARSNGISLAEEVRRRLEPEPLPAGATANPSLTTVGDPANHTPPTGERQWGIAELQARLRSVPNDGGGRTMWLASDADYADPRLRALITHAAVPDGHLGLVAPGRGGRVWLEGRWVEPAALAEALRAAVGGSHPYFLMVPEALAGPDPFAARLFEANGHLPVVASADHVLIDQYRGTVIAVTIDSAIPRLDRTGPDGQFVQIVDVRHDRTDPARIDGIQIRPRGSVHPPGARAVHTGDFVSLVEVPTEGRGGPGRDHPGQARTVDVPVAPSGASIGPADNAADAAWAGEAYRRFRGDPGDVVDIAENLAGLWSPEARARLTAEDIAHLDKLAGDWDGRGHDGLVERLRASIAEIRQYSFLDEHLLPGEHIPRRFVPNAGVAEAWIRLREGRWHDEWTEQRHELLSRDLLLLAHELDELTYLRDHPKADYPDVDYLKAHHETERLLNWARDAPPATGEDLDNLWPTWRNTYGDSGGLHEDMGGRRPGGVHLRPEPHDGPAPRDRQAHETRGSTGWADQRSLPSGVLQDPLLAGTSGALAGGGIIRVLTDGGQVSGAHDGVPRWRASDLTSTGVVGTIIRGELHVDANGDKHFVGDRVGTWRDDLGHLHDARGYATDDNRPPPLDVAAPAVPERSWVLPSDGAEPTAVAVRQAFAERDAAAAAKEAVWRHQVDPIADALRNAGMTVERTTFGSEAATKALAGAREALTPAERLQARSASADYATAAADLVRASERLGIAGGDHAVATLYPHARPVSGGDGGHQPQGTLDRVIFVDDPHPVVVVVEEKGGELRLGTRNVPDPADPTGTIKAEQASPEYVNALLSLDPQLAAALQADPQLRVVMQRTVTSGQIKCVVVHTSPRGVVTLTEYRLDPDRLRAHAIELPGARGRRG